MSPQFQSVGLGVRRSKTESGRLFYNVSLTSVDLLLPATGVFMSLRLRLSVLSPNTPRMMAHVLVGVRHLMRTEEYSLKCVLCMARCFSSYVFPSPNFVLNCLLCYNA